MQITAPSHPVAESTRQIGRRTSVRLWGHKQRGSFRLPWRLNAAITAVIGLGAAICVLMQL